eukprot:gene26564-biopygen16870
MRCFTHIMNLLQSSGAHASGACASGVW